MSYALQHFPSAVSRCVFGSLVLLVSTLASAEARADVGVQLGPHAGVALDEDVDPYLGAGVQLTAPSSPFTLQPTYHYVFDENQTLYHIGGNVVYELPVAFPQAVLWGWRDIEHVHPERAFDDRR